MPITNHGHTSNGVPETDSATRARQRASYFFHDDVTGLGGREKRKDSLSDRTSRPRFACAHREQRLRVRGSGEVRSSEKIRPNFHVPSVLLLVWHE